MTLSDCLECVRTHVSKLVRENAGGTLYFLLGDHLGSTSVVANTSAVAVSTIGYKPWGEIRYTGGTWPAATTFLFTGQREETALNAVIFMGSRWYDSRTFRFMSADTIVPGAGNPQALNRYSYVLGNPLKYTDSSGHSVDCG